jgi:hypothetical protein
VHTTPSPLREAFGGFFNLGGEPTGASTRAMSLQSEVRETAAAEP